MGIPMTTSAMTDGQIDRACELLRAKLIKHRAKLPSDAVQLAFGDSDLMKEWLASLHRRVMYFSQTFVEEVDYDQYRAIQHDCYAFVGDVTISDYPETETGKKLVRFREIRFYHDPSDEEVLAQTEYEGCRQPTRAEAETVIRRYTPYQLFINPRIGLTGLVVRHDGIPSRAYVSGCEDGVHLNWHWDNHRGLQDNRFVVICK